MTARVALVTCAQQDRGDPDEQILSSALSDLGIESLWVSWDSESVPWSNFDVVVVRSTWDYVDRRDEFLAWAATVANLHNPADVLRTNTDKRYLRTLEQRGVDIVPTMFVEKIGSYEFPAGNFVVKPTVGAGSRDASRYSARDHEAAAQHVERLLATDRIAMIQPYVHTVDDVGETALVFIDGEFSHAMRKGAMLNAPALDRTGLFMMEQMSVTEVSDDVIAVGTQVLAASQFGRLLYGRVDLVYHEGTWVLMELEVTEPSLFLSFHQPTAQRLAQAIVARLG